MREGVCGKAPSLGLTLSASSSSFAKLLPLKSMLGALTFPFLAGSYRLQSTLIRCYSAWYYPMQQA